MSRKSALEASVSAMAQADVMGAVPIQPGQIVTAMGDSASADALERLKRSAQEIKTAENGKIVGQAIEAVHKQDFAKAEKLAMKLLKKDEQLGLGWHILAIAREKQGDFASSLKCYEAALTLLTDHSSVAGDLGRLAFRMNMFEFAAKFFAHFRLARPDDVEAANNLACALRELNRENEAIEVLKAVLRIHPEAPGLWNTLGTILCNVGDPGGSLVFFDEALRLAPRHSKTLHNRAYAKADLGDIAGALIDGEAAMKESKDPADLVVMEFARATLLLALGRIAEGWQAYEARFSPEIADAPLFHIPAARWSGEDLKGKTLLIVAEQGLGDEVMFSNMLPDILDWLGPDGRLTLVVEHRLKPLLERSFPGVEVSSHRTMKYEGRVYRTAPYIEDWERFDCWAALGDFLRPLRNTVEAFPHRKSFLSPDPERVAYWKAELDKLGPSPKIGLLWKSLSLKGDRARQFSPFQLWEPVLKTPGVTLINLQYGDCEEEIALAKEQFGVEIWQPPGIDLKQDLDELTALCCAVDLIIGFSNATTNLAGAAGAPIWMLTAPAVWTKLGTDAYPWYPQARVFSPPELGQWAPVMAEVAQALREKVAG
ncbi:tetratricopeptide repeat protein [Caulobacter sp. FWC2]|uniref:tetratricopeptide repeat-containing glycosyltransferase family protein n=1 Tax=Caulobacter sp. FWC2 TaxID=69664 RepID=UPI000C15E03E|nr:tetratricopeptide repeat-containing glycosyltransferase family protein [Caulobacter sp. FWC2]PIB92221.1 flagellar protein FlbA [Caulobacter sp. FWC2]